MPQRFFKYASAETAEKILCNRTLRWSAPALFNDPFEFKSPLEFGFEWEELEEPLLEEITRLITQPEPPELLEGGPTTYVIRNARIAYAASHETPSDIRKRYRGTVTSIINWLRRDDDRYRQIWPRLKRQWRVLCLSEVPSNILMWSHYGNSHQGVVLEFEPRVELRSTLVGAKEVQYSKEVNTAASLKDFVAYVTSQGPKPIKPDSLERSVFRKSEDWAYEKEWRIVVKDVRPGAELFLDRPFDATELVAIYFGCRAFEKIKVEITTIAKALGTPVSFFEMRDERIRFELTPVKLSS
jgi:Protein of unknown function (DUF2971)